MILILKSPSEIGLRSYARQAVEKSKILRFRLQQPAPSPDADGALINQSVRGEFVNHELIERIRAEKAARRERDGEK